MKTILGLDLGTNSIGWALVECNTEARDGKILGMGSRIIPMTQDVLDKFSGGKPTETQTAARTGSRGVRRLRERHLLRRERLHRVLNILGFLPEHYADLIDFEKHFGQFTNDAEPKLPWRKTSDGAVEFIFQSSFNEMLADFRQAQPLLLHKNKKGEPAKIPYDWTIYYLRKKALSRKIEKAELAWLILNFNQKRGYYQLRGEEEEENPNKSVEFHSLKIVDVIADEKPNSKGDIWYSLLLENGWVYRRSSKTPLFDWKDKVRDFIVTTDLDDNGNVKTDKEGGEKRSFRSPGKEDWTLLMKKTEADIKKSQQTVGTYIYDTLLQNPSQKIRGKLVRTIERKYYRDELKQILKKQKEFHPELQDGELYNDCVRELYKHNEAHQLVLSKSDFTHLFLDDIIFYQRPLRSQKSLVGNCALEYRIYRKDGVEIKDYLKVISKSNPYYQEFRIWQWLSNLSIYRKDSDANVTAEFLNSSEEYESLFEFLNERKEIEQEPLIKYLLERKGFRGKSLNTESEKYRWNFVEDKKYPCNDTHYQIARRMEKIDNLPHEFLTCEIEQELWHIIYSVTDKIEFEKALKRFANRHQLDKTSFVEAFRKFPPFKSEYGAYSEKAIKKLLPLMRLGKYWEWEAIDPDVRKRIDKLLTGEYDATIPERVREKVVNLTEESHFQGLPLWLAQYVVYGRHSEAGVVGKWNSVNDLNIWLNEFRQHSLRNPIVEQVVAETMRVVRDIWMRYGNGASGFFDEIHIELGREMKNTADERKRMNENITENENTNLRIKALLMELKEDEKIENVRPYSPMQQDILKLYEEFALQNDDAIDVEIAKISRMAQPTKAELQRYKLYLEQRCRSPYTGQIIPLSKLFTKEYEIEHIIPRSRYFDDSFNNKIICEAAVNGLKDNSLGFEFIKNCHGQKVETGFGRTVTIFTEEEYKKFVQDHYGKYRVKRNNLLLEEIPDEMIKRQMNDTRYISKFISSVLSNIVRENVGDDGMNSKNVVPCNGKITAELRQDWGLNDVWNDLILPRFQRMNELKNSDEFTAWNEQHQKYLPTVPFDELFKGFQKKRIDHRHHAMDALVIACATQNHINLLNNKHAKSDHERHDLKRKLMRFEKTSYFDRKTGKQVEREIPKDFIKPWNTFTVDAKEALGQTVISFKQNLRVINKATNRYEKWVEKDGRTIKEQVKQEGVNWAIRKPLHKGMVFGKVNLRGIKIPKDKIAVAIRKELTPNIDLTKITDTGIQKILKNYLLANNNNPELAFSPEGIEGMNRNIALYNDQIPHQPIYNVRLYELGSRFALGTHGNKADKYVEAEKGTNLFFAIYVDNDGNRSYDTIPLNEVIEYLKQGLEPVPKTNEKGHSLLFYLSPNDLVYVPTEEERGNRVDLRNLESKRIYKMVSCTKGQCHFIPHHIASPIVQTTELGSNNKSERSWDGVMIKLVCIKLNIDCLGNIKL
jgi:CRISPR-associated endonuclease Csn1